MQPGVKKSVLKSGVLSEVVWKVAVIDLGFERTWDFWGEQVGRTKMDGNNKHTEDSQETAVTE